MTGLPTLLDIMKLDGGIGYNVVNETVKQRPELALIPADTLTGTSMELTVLSRLPTVSFRNYNEGSDRAKGQFTTRLFQCMPIDTPIQVDRRLADKSKDRFRFLENTSFPVMEAVLNHMCSQFWYGTTNDAKGFPGIIAQSNTAATHVKDAGGNSYLTSVWFVSVGRERLEWLFGNNRTITMEDGWKEVTINDDNNKPFPGLENWIHGDVGMRLANKAAAVRIKNIEDDAYKVTDTLLYAGLRLCNDLNINPTHVFMNSRSLHQLRDQRTATSTTGAPAPLPKDFEGIPIVMTPFITNAETI